LMWVWLGVVTAFFSIPNSKLIGYILPAIAPLAFLIADASRLHERIAAARSSFAARSWSGHRLQAATAALAATLCVAMIVAAHYRQPKSLQALALQLQALRQAHEPVIFVGNYHYDLPIYAGLDAPVVVVDPWSAEEVAHDSWRRELVDAARFAPAEARRRLLHSDALAAALCSAPASWVIGPWPPAPEPRLLATLVPAYAAGGTALWRVVPSAPRTRAELHCAEPVVPAR
jgi:hypothetical protein